MKNVYSVYDEASSSYSEPFYALNDGVAVRMMQNSINNPQSLFYTHPHHFTLMKIGVFHEHTGELEPRMPVKSVMTILEIRSLSGLSDSSQNNAQIDAFAEKVG